MDQIDITIIGAGVVGLATAAKISEANPELSVLVVEQHEGFGKETSSRNSEVIHSGIYYPTGSVKAHLCVEGKQLLYEFCEKWSVDYKRIGKLIIARNDDEIKYLESLYRTGIKNGVADLELLEKEQLNVIEPNIKAVAAIYSPSTGIVDSHQLMARLEAQAKHNGTLFAYRHKILDIEKQGEQFKLAFEGPSGQVEHILSRWIVNSAGLSSDKVAAFCGIDIDEAKYRIYPCKGEYFSITGTKAEMVNHLIYPPPLQALKGLGIHVTKSLDGRMRLGPNAHYVEELNYDVEHQHQEEFFEGVKTYLPFLEKSDLQPDMAGVRPKVQGPNDSWRDFIIKHEAERSLSGLVNLIGIESPGLTSCLSIAKNVNEIIQQTL